MRKYGDRMPGCGSAGLDRAQLRGPAGSTSASVKRPINLQHLVAVMVDDLDGDAPGLGFLRIERGDRVYSCADRQRRAEDRPLPRDSEATRFDDPRSAIGGKRETGARSGGVACRFDP